MSSEDSLKRQGDFDPAYTRERIAELERIASLYKETLIELAAAEKRFAYLFEGAGDSIFIVDAATMMIIAANAHASRRLGYTHQEILTLKLADLEVPQAVSGIGWTSEASDTLVAENVYRRKDGVQIPVETSSRLSRYGDREVWQVFVRDITERKRAEERERALAVEKERVRLISNFIKSASQEFRTPLSIVNTKTYLLARTVEAGKALDLVRDIEAQTAYMGDLVAAILSMAQLESGAEFSFAPLDLNQLMTAIQTQFRHLIQKKQMIFSLDLDNNLSMIWADRDKLLQAFANLVKNALDYTAEGGTISVRTLRRGQAAVVEIEDTGTGIAAADLLHIFDPFHRVDEARSARRAGLGLPIAQKIISAHKGEIRVESTPGMGSVFRVIIPLLD